MYYVVPNISVVFKEILEILGRYLYVKLVALLVVRHVPTWVNCLTPRTHTVWDAFSVFRICALDTDEIRIARKEVRDHATLVVSFNFGNVAYVGVCVLVVVVIIVRRRNFVVVCRYGTQS